MIFLTDWTNKPNKPLVCFRFVSLTFLTSLYKDIETKLSVLLEGDVRRFVSDVWNVGDLAPDIPLKCQGYLLTFLHPSQNPDKPRPDIETKLSVLLEGNVTLRVTKRSFVTPSGLYQVC